VGSDLVSAVGSLSNGLWGARDELEAVLLDDNVGGVGAAGDLLAVGAMAESLYVVRNPTVVRGAGKGTCNTGSPSYEILVAPQKQAPEGILRS
jgi:hypothetical protein